MSERTQRINTADFPTVREVHATEQELIDLALRALSADEENELRAHLNTCGQCRERLAALHVDDGMGATKVRDPLVGAMLGEYRVDAALARGGMGVVYRGVHPLIGKQVAIKVLIPELDEDQGINRLLDEARAVNAIRHPNIIDIFSFGTLPDGRHYFVMELLDGKSIDEVINERRVLSADEVMTVLEQSCSALGAAHMAGVVHRDLKPANLFVSVLPDRAWHITVLDFGLAKRVGNTRKTATNLVMGTPGFMAPEQIRGKVVTAATDLYAMGVVAWVLLTGAEPFHADGIIDLLRAHIDQPLPSLQALAPKAPPPLVALIERLLAKRPEDRPASALDVRNELQRIRTGAARAPATPLMRGPAQRKGGLIPAGMPSSELEDAVAATRVRTANAKTRPRMDAQARPPRELAAPEPIAGTHRKTEIKRPAPAPAPVEAQPRSRWPWLLGAFGVLAVGIGALWAARSAQSTKTPAPEPAVDAGAVAAFARAEVDAGAAVTELVELDAGAPPITEVQGPDASAPTAEVKPRPDAGVRPASVVKPDRRKSLNTRLQALDKRFTQAIARGGSFDLELAEVRGLQQGLGTRADERSLDAIETAVQRLERLRP